MFLVEVCFALRSGGSDSDFAFVALVLSQRQDGELLLCVCTFLRQTNLS